MAVYRITYGIHDNEVLHELRFMGATFSYTMLHTPTGTQANAHAFDIQIEEEFPDIGEEILELVELMTYGDDELLEALAALTAYEERNFCFTDSMGGITTGKDIEKIAELYGIEPKSADETYEEFRDRLKAYVNSTGGQRNA